MFAQAEFKEFRKVEHRSMRRCFGLLGSPSKVAMKRLVKEFCIETRAKLECISCIIKLLEKNDGLEIGVLEELKLQQQRRQGGLWQQVVDICTSTGFWQAPKGSGMIGRRLLRCDFKAEDKKLLIDVKEML